MKRAIPLLFLYFISLSTFAQFNWQHTQGPEGGPAHSMYVIDDYAYYGDQYNLYRTFDGMSWEAVTDKYLWPVVGYNGTLVAQEIEYDTYNYYVGRNLLISQDNGITWTKTNFPEAKNSTTEGGMVMCSHGLYITDGQNHKMYRSQDEGQTWDTLTPPVQYGYNIQVIEDRLYMEENGVIWRTDTNGTNWAVFLNLDANQSASYCVIDSHIMLSTSDYIYHSHNGGLTWDTMPAVDSIYALRLEPVNDTTILGIPINGVIGIGIAQLVKTNDFGATWTVYPAYLNDYTVNIKSFKGNLYVCAYNKGFYRWDESAEKFTPASSGYNSAAIYDIDYTDNKVIAMTGDGLHSYDKQTELWDTTYLPFPYTGESKFSVGDNGLMVIHVDYEKYFILSEDYGQTWDTIHPDPLSSYIQSAFVINDLIVISSSGKTYRSTDLGQTWQLVNNKLRYAIKFNNILISRQFSNVLSSTDNGTTWDTIASFGSNTGVKNLLAVENRLFALVLAIDINGFYTTKVYTSTDAVTWKYANDGLPYNVNSSYDDPYYFCYHKGIYFFYNPDFGFYASTDTCKTWTPIERRLFQYVTFTDSTFYMGAFGGGVVKSTVPNVYQNIFRGLTFYDKNNNGIYDASDIGIPDIPVGVHTSNTLAPFYYTKTDSAGNYVLGVVPRPEDTVQPHLSTLYVESITPPFYSTDNAGNNKDFAIYLTPNVTDLQLHGKYFPRLRPGFDSKINMRYVNIGTTEPHATFSIQLDTKLEYLSASPQPDAIYGDSLVWNISTIPLFSHKDISICIHVPDTTPLGIPIKCSGRITPTSPDSTPANNIRILIDTTVGSYDPNEKEVEPKDGLTVKEIEEGKEIFYTVYFQNTGTWQADKVRITDQIDTALYLPSLRLVSASHSITRFELKPGGLLEIVFDNINLPDSTSNEPESHGYVTFAIQRKKHFNPNVPVRNYAAIYFDFNDPIFTNEVSFSIKSTPVVSTQNTYKRTITQLHIFPNPTKSHFTIVPTNVFHGHGTLQLYNITGQLCYQQQVIDMEQPIQVHLSDLANGLYYVRLSGYSGSAIGRVLINKH